VDPLYFTLVYSSIDDDLVNMASHNTAMYRIDNGIFYDFLKQLIIGGEGYPFMQKFDRLCDRRGAYLPVKSQAEGPAAMATQKAEAYKNIKEAKFTGMTPRYSFNKYVRIHPENHNKLALLGEPVSETKKVSDFLEQISAPSLATAKENVLGDLVKLENFQACQQYLKQVLLSQKARNTASSTIAAVGTKKKGGKGSGGGGASKRKGKRKVSAIKTSHYVNDDWFKLPKETRDQIQKLRKDKKKQRIASLSSSEIDATTAANTVKNASTISKVTVFKPPTVDVTSVSEKVATIAALTDSVKTNKVTFREYAQAKSAKSVVNPVGDADVASVSFGISSLKIIPDNPSGTSEWNDGVTKEMSNLKPTFNSPESIVVGIAFTTPLEDEEEMESNEDSDNSTIDEPPNILEDIFGGLQLVDAPVIDAGSIVVHRNHRETIDGRNAFFRLVDRPGFPPMVVFTPPLPSTRVVADSFLSSTNHDPQVHRNLDGTVSLVFTSEYIRELYAPVAPTIPWSSRQFPVWVPPHVLNFVPETSEEAVNRENMLAHRRWKRFMTFMVVSHVDLHDHEWQPPALDQLPPESNDPRGQFVWSQFPYSARFEFDWRAFPT
jgi:hypothetical protein